MRLFALVLRHDVIFSIFFTEEYILEDPKAYPFLREENHIVPGVDDSAEFEATVKSMNIMGMTQEDFNAIFRIVSAVMLFGTMQFKQDRNSDQATLPDNTVAQKVAHLLGLSVTEMTKAFLKPRIKVGRDFVTKSQTKEQVFTFTISTSCTFFMLSNVLYTFG